MAIVNQTSCPADLSKFEQHATYLRAAVSKWLNPKWLNLCAISLAVAVAGCAQDPRPRNVAAAPPQVRTASATPVTPARRHAERYHLQARIRQFDPALLAPQPAPDCEYKKSDVKTVDPDEWARLKSEYELQCYRETEKAARTRLGLLQSSVRHLQD
jgi:predicted secreted Zn-dependent protease